MLLLPEFAVGRIEGEAFRVAQAIGPDLRQRALLADERIVGRRRSVGTNAYDLADMVVERLRHVGGGKMIAERDEQIAVARLHHAAADVQAVRDGAALAEDRGHRDQARGPAILLQPPMRDRDAAAALGRLGVAEINRSILFEVAAEHHIHEAGLALRVNSRHAGERRRQLAGARDDAQAAGPFAHQHSAVGQERERPGMHQPAGDDLDRKISGGGGECLRRRSCGARRRQQQRRQQ